VSKRLRVVVGSGKLKYHRLKPGGVEEA